MSEIVGNDDSPRNLSRSVIRRTAGPAKLPILSILSVGVLFLPGGFCVDLQRVAHIGQSIDCVVADGNYAYIGEGAGLRVLDVSNPANPQPLGRVSLLAFCASVAKKENFVFCALLDKGMQVVNVSNPQFPQVVFSYRTAWSVDGGVWWHDLEIEGNRLYAASGSGGAESGIHVFNIADPSSPNLIGHFAGVRSWVRGLDVKNNIVYAAVHTAGGIQVIDFSSPSTPFEAGFLPMGSESSVYDVLMEDNRAYVAGSWQYGLVVLNSSTPASPTVLGSYNTPNIASNLVKSGQYVYVSDMWDNPGVVVVNVTNPANPQLQTTLSVPGTAIKGLWIDSNRLFVSSLTALSIFSLSNPASPTLLGSYFQRDALGHPWGVRAKDGYLYVSDFRMGLKIFDIADPSNPMYLGKYRISTEAEGVEVRGNVAYVCSSWGNGIEVIDLSDRNHPDLIVKITLPGSGSVKKAKASGNYLYTVGSEGGVFVLEISNPFSPAFENRFDTDGIAQDLAIVGNALFVADGATGVKVIDISSAPTLSLLTSITGIGNVMALDADGPRAIVGVSGTTKYEIRSYDISNPASPIFRDSIYSWFPNDLKISGHYALVQNHKAGIWAYDISNLADLVKVSEFDTEGSCSSGIDIDGEYIYSCDWLGGLNVFTVSGGLGAPTSTPTETPSPTPTQSPTPDLSRDENTWLTDALQGSTHGIPNSVTMTQFGAALDSPTSSIVYSGRLPIDQGSISFWLSLLEGNAGGVLFTDEPQSVSIDLAGQDIHFKYRQSSDSQWNDLGTTLPFTAQLKRRPVHVQVGWGPSGQRIYLNGELAAEALARASPRLVIGTEIAMGLGRMPGLPAQIGSARNVLVSNLVVTENEVFESWQGLVRPNFEPYPEVASSPCDPPNAPTASILLVRGTTSPGDQRLNDFLVAQGHIVESTYLFLVSTELYDDYDLVIVSGSNSADRIPSIHEAQVPVIIGEGAILSQNNNPSDMHMFYGNSNPSTRNHLWINVLSPNHPIMQGFPSPLKLYQTNNNESLIPLRQIDYAAPGTTILASPMGLPDYAAISVVEKGAILADGSRAPARRVQMPVNEGLDSNVFGNLTPEGKELVRRLVNWALGAEFDCFEEPTETPTETASPTPTSTQTPTVQIPSATPTGIVGDLDQSGKVGPEDILLLLQNWKKGIE